MDSLTFRFTFRGRETTRRRLGTCALGVYRQAMETRAVSPWRKVSQWMLEYCSADAGEILLPAEGRALRRPRLANTVHLYGPGCIFREDTRQAETPFRETALLFDGGEACGLGEILDPRFRLCLLTDRDRRVTGLLEEAADLCLLKGENGFWLVQSILFRVLDALLNFSRETAPLARLVVSRESPEDSFVQEAEAFMRRNIQARIRNRDIAAALNMSESSFNHRFREITGITPNARLNGLRVDMARGYLLKGARLREVAAATGFRDEFYLSRVFRRVTGLTPSAYRRGTDTGPPSKA